MISLRRVSIVVVVGGLLAWAAPGVSEARADDASAAAAQKTFQGQCATCHGAEGKGDGPGGIEVLPVPRDFSVGRFKFDADGDGRVGTDEDLFLVIRNGASAVGGNPLMISWAHLGDDHIRELVVYVRGLERPGSD